MSTATPSAPALRSARPAGAATPRRGFTIPEMVIAFGIVAIITAIALPSYLDSQRKGRRTEGVAALNDVQQRQERWRSSNPAYLASVTDPWGGTPPGLGLPARTRSGYYDIAVSLIGTGEVGFVATATAVSGTSQDKDGNCKVLGVRFNAGTSAYGAAATAAALDWTAANPDPNRCWAR